MLNVKDNKDLATGYQEAISEYLKKGYAEEVTDKTPLSDNIYYMPHSCVVREEKSTKIRIVFDASSKSKGCKSLNDVLSNGPCLIPKVVDILIRFRRYPIALVADIRKMFLQIAVDERDRDVLRYLWRDLNSSNPPKVYRMKVVTFGVISSPFLSMATVIHHAEVNKSAYNLECEKLKRDLYVDDLLSGARSISEARNLSNNLNKLMKKGGFELAKWSSSNQGALIDISDDDKVTDSVLLSNESDNNQKTLGVRWNPSSDTFGFYGYDSIICGATETKRSLTSKVARLFDPLGLISPLMIEPKLILRKVWASNNSWDADLDSSYLKLWETWVSQLNKLCMLSFERCVTNYDEIEGEITLHGFCDASLVAYAAVIYVVVKDPSNNVKSTILLSKARLCPKDNKFSIARLELLGAVLLARLMEAAKSSLNVDGDKCFYWTDSLITFYWLRKSHQSWKEWVSNRVKEIQTNSEALQWRHVPGTDNPADLASRGVNIEQFISKLQFWSNGPNFIKMDRQFWPVISHHCPVADIDKEARKIVLMVSDNVSSPFADKIKFERWNQIVRTIAYVIKFVSKLRNKSASRNWKMSPGKLLHPDELWAAELVLIRQIQKDSFGEDFLNLSSGETVSKSSKIYRLCPYWDDKLQLIRIKDRLSRFPILLPSSKDNELLVKLVLHHHKSVMHNGPGQTLAHLRHKFWLINGMSVVASIIRKCLSCIRYDSKAKQQQMAPLPEERIMFNNPFSIVGVDFAGPLFVADDDDKTKTIKGWICLFTCGTTRGVHLEFVKNLTTESFLLTLENMMSRRGLAKVVISDNAKTFKKASKEIESIWNHVDSKLIQEKTHQKGIEWKFITEKAPWMGGFYERLNRSIKSAFRKNIGRNVLSESTFINVLLKIEQSLNSRPLSVIKGNADEPIPISPAQLMMNRNLNSIPKIKVDENSSSIIKQLKFRQTLYEQFINRWQSEYLCELSIRQKWLKDEALLPYAKGDVVLIKKDNSSRIYWPLARVTELVKGRDGLIRSAFVTLNGRKLKRPINQIYPLEG